MSLLRRSIIKIWSVLWNFLSVCTVHFQALADFSTSLVKLKDIQKKRVTLLLQTESSKRRTLKVTLGSQWTHTDSSTVWGDADVKTKRLPSGMWPQGSDPGLHCWWLGSQRLSFYGILQSLCFPVTNRVKGTRLFFKSFPPNAVRRERDLY